MRVKRKKNLQQAWMNNNTTKILKKTKYIPGFHLGRSKGGHLPPLDPECPPLDFDFILPHSLVVDVAPP